ncbi:hypothetical protein N7466_004588 [Penicillium verhagenii]|uniref:uncharacterized protein n=1 Tax=Penicillium verhagenii TaxID=1562060 RepID=UPI00254551EF|nr:uncharacterized protein N7466_004588 [Penicillium verhagenii]KAJ5935041.1 hypothetical protein N7466_004588 [Penicillium verhagenii]
MSANFVKNLTKQLRNYRLSTPWSHSRSRSPVYSDLGKNAYWTQRQRDAWKLPCLPFTPRRDEWGKMRACPWIAGAVLFLNIILALVAFGIGYSKKANKGQFEMVELYQGSCNVSNRMATVLHLMINVLSTVLLGVSNYTMQCLGAPSRADVELAHQKHKWLDIGTFSIRNLGVMNWKRRTLWGLLLLSSVPIHMLYNSVVFRSISDLDYGLLIVPDDLSSSESLVEDKVARSAFYDAIGISAVKIHAEIFDGTFYNTTLSDCVEQYDTAFNNKYNTNLGTVILTAERQYLQNVSSMYGPADDISDYDAYSAISEIKQFATNGTWNVTAEFWSYRTWDFKAPDGRNFSSIDDVLDIYINENKSVIADDLVVLGNYLSQNNPSATSLQTYLNTKSHWENSTWAADITFHFAGHHSNPGYDLSFPVTGCKYKSATERCQIFFSPPIAITVVGCNVVKVICMVLAARMSRTGIFFTVGDSVASFLVSPDPTTKNRCLLSRVDVMKGSEIWSRPIRTFNFAHFFSSRRNSDPPKDMDILLRDNNPDSTNLVSSTVHPRLICPKKKRWCQAATWRRWTVTSIVFIFCEVYFTFIFILGAIVTDAAQEGSVSTFFADIWSLGFGSVNTDTLEDMSEAGSLVLSNTMFLILISNSPQFFLSIIYFLTNGLLTCMLGAAEWDRNAFQRRPLRVSKPQGDQRSTFYLTLPYRYGVPNLIFFALTHWMVSESFFFVNVQGYDVHNVKADYSSVQGWCFSALPAFIASLLLLLGWIVLVSLGLKRFKTHAPLVAHCSAAISASCHPPPDDIYAAYRPLMWGEVDRPDNILGDGEWSHDGSSGEQTESSTIGEIGLAAVQTSYGHCSLTSKEVQTPQLDRMYY